MKQNISSTEAYTATAKSCYICANCGVAIKKSHIAAKQAAGFSTHHIECPECGQHTIKDKDNE